MTMLSGQKLVRRLREFASSGIVAGAFVRPGFAIGIGAAAALSFFASAHLNLAERAGKESTRITINTSPETCLAVLYDVHRTIDGKQVALIAPDAFDRGAFLIGIVPAQRAQEPFASEVVEALIDYAFHRGILERASPLSNEYLFAVPKVEHAAFRIKTMIDAAAAKFGAETEAFISTCRRKIEQLDAASLQREIAASEKTVYATFLDQFVRDVFEERKIDASRLQRTKIENAPKNADPNRPSYGTLGSIERKAIDDWFGGGPKRAEYEEVRSEPGGFETSRHEVGRIPN